MIYRVVDGIDCAAAIVSSRFGFFWKWRYAFSAGKWAKVQRKYRAFFDPSLIISARKITKAEIFIELL